MIELKPIQSSVPESEFSVRTVPSICNEKLAWRLEKAPPFAPFRAGIVPWRQWWLATGARPKQYTHI